MFSFYTCVVPGEEVKLVLQFDFITFWEIIAESLSGVSSAQGSISKSEKLLEKQVYCTGYARDFAPKIPLVEATARAFLLYTCRGTYTRLLPLLIVKNRFLH